jgi:hypothetical protein
VLLWQGDGDDELKKWQKIRERELAHNRKRRVTFDVAQVPIFCHVLWLCLVGRSPVA